MKPRRPLPSPIVKRSINLDRHKTSVALEDAFWNALKEIATTQKTSVGQLVLKIDRARKNNNLSSEIRLFVLDYYRRAASR